MRADERQLYLEKGFGLLLILLIVFTAYNLAPLLDSLGNFLTRLLYPFILAFVLYYLLRPIVNYLNSKMSPYLSISITFVVLAVLLVLASVYIYPILISQINTLLKIPLETNAVTERSFRFFNYTVHINDVLRNTVSNFVIKMNTLIMENFMTIIGHLTEFLIGLTAVPLILFYLLKDDALIYEGLLKQIPEKHTKNSKDFLEELDSMFGHFITGRVYVSFLVSMILFIGFLILQVNYPVLLFITSFILIIIPTVGSIIALIPPLLVGFSMSNTMGIEVFVLMMAAFAIEGAWITPKITGSTLVIHPLTVIVILWIGGLMGGIVGLILAIPFYGFIKIIMKYAPRFSKAK